jgi:hypothetical protein
MLKLARLSTTGACFIKLFTAVLTSAVQQACVLVTTNHFNPSLIFQGDDRRV